MHTNTALSSLDIHINDNARHRDDTHLLFLTGNELMRTRFLGYTTVRIRRALLITLQEGIYSDAAVFNHECAHVLCRITMTRTYVE